MNDRIAILREAITKITQLLAGKGIKVTQRGMTAGVKHDHEGRPTEVNLPYLPDNCPEELVGAIQGFLDKEVANLLFTDYKIASEAKKAGVIELFNHIEGVQVEKSMERRFAGSAHNIGVMRDFFVNKYLRFEVSKLSAPGKEKELTSLLVGPAFRAFAGQYEFKKFMDEKGLMAVVKPITDRLGSLMDEIEHVKSTAESLDLAKRMQEKLKGASSEEEGEGEEGEGGGKSKKSKKGGIKGEKSEKKETTGADGDTDGEEKNPDGEGSGEKPEKSEGEGEGDGEEEEGEAEKEKAGSGKGEGEGEGEEGEGEEEGDEEEAEKPEAATISSEEVTSDSDGEEETGGSDGGSGEGDKGDGEEEREAVEYRESDMSGAIGESASMSDVVATITSKESAIASKGADYLPYTKDGDKVEAFDINSGYSKFKDSMLEELEKATAHMVAPLQKDIERSISAKTQSTWQAGQRKGRLNSAGLARLATGDDRVFRRKSVANSKDVAVELVIDCSGSMSGHKIQVASQTAYALAQVLERLNIKSEIIGFTTTESPHEREADKASDSSGIRFSRYEALYMPVFKSFDERLDTETKRRIAYLPYWGRLANNVDGECVETAYRRLMRRQEHRKIMIVLSDGSPACHGDNSAVRKHLQDVVKGIEDSKVDIIGIGICSDAVNRFYSKHIVINDVDDLPGKVMGELKKMLMAGIK